MVQEAVYVVDDDRDVLMSVEALLSLYQFEPACFSSPRRFLDVAVTEEPGCLITDYRMPEMTGLELQQELVERKSPLTIVVVTGVAKVPQAVQFMEAGAVTLLQKPYQDSQLLEAVRRGIDESRKNWDRIQSKQQVSERLASLTSNEKAVMSGMLKGEPNKTISSRLEVGMRTVDRRKKSILEKMGVNSTPELARLLSVTFEGDWDST